MRKSSSRRAAFFATTALLLLDGRAASAAAQPSGLIDTLLFGAGVAPPPALPKADRLGAMLLGASASGPEAPAPRLIAASDQALPPERPARQPSPAFPAPDPATLLLLLVQLDDLTLSDGLAAYGAPEDPLLPVGELSRLLELDIDVSPTDGRITGSLGEARRALVIDLATNTARIGPVSVTLAPGDVAVEPNDIYVRASVLMKLLPLRLAIDPAGLQMRITALELLPIQGRLQRLARLRQGAGGQAGAPVMRTREPYHLFRPPSVDVAIGVGAQTQSPNYPTRYDIRLGGDLLYSGLQAYIGSDDEGRASTTRVLLERRSLDGNLLGPLHARVVGLGDVFTPSLPIGPRSLGGRGIQFSTVPLDQTTVFNRVDLRGELPLGSDVEIYVNDVLQGAQSQASRGQYEFLNVPLSQGVNVVRIVTYGPRGQRSEETRIINAGGGLLHPGEATLDFAAVEQDEALIRVGDFDPLAGDPAFGKRRVVASFNYGISQFLTGSLGGALYTDHLGVERQLGIAGLRTSIAGFATEVNVAGDDKGGGGADISVAGRVLGVNALLRHAEYRGGLLDENNAEADVDRPVSQRTELTLDDNLAFGARIVPLSLRVLRDRYDDGGSAWISQMRGSASYGPVLYSTGLEYDRITTRNGRTTDRSRAFLAASTFRKYQWQVRSQLDFDLAPDARLSDLTVTLDRELSNRWSLRFGATQRIDDPQGLELIVGSTTRTKIGDLTLTGQYDTHDNSWRLAAQVNFGIGYNPAHGYELTRQGPGSGGSVLFHAFVDSNGNGRYDPGERPVSGVSVEGGDLKVHTGPDGRAYVSGFGAAPTARVLVGLSEIDNPAVKSPPLTVEFTPRPGGITDIEYPLLPTGDVMVNLKLRRPDGQSVGLSATRLKMVDAKGQAFEGVTEFDGSVNFQDLPAGTYTLQLDAEQAQRLRMRLLSAITVTIKPDGSLNPDVTAEVAFAPRAEP